MMTSTTRTDWVLDRLNPLTRAADRGDSLQYLGETAMVWAVAGLLAGAAGGALAAGRESRKARKVKDTSVVDLPLKTGSASYAEHLGGLGPLKRVAHSRGVGTAVLLAAAAISYRLGRDAYDKVIGKDIDKLYRDRKRDEVADMFSKEHQRLTGGKTASLDKEATKGLRIPGTTPTPKGVSGPAGSEGTPGWYGIMDWTMVFLSAAALATFGAGAVMGYKRQTADDPRRRKKEMLKNLAARHEADIHVPPRIHLGALPPSVRESPSRRPTAVLEPVGR